MLRTTISAINRSTRLIHKPLSISGTRFYHEKVRKREKKKKMMTKQLKIFFLRLLIIMNVLVMSDLSQRQI